VRTKLLIIDDEYVKVLKLKSLIFNQKSEYSVMTEIFSIASMKTIQTIMPDLIILGDIFSKKPYSESADYILDLKKPWKTLLIAKDTEKARERFGERFDAIMAERTLTPDLLCETIDTLMQPHATAVPLAQPSPEPVGTLSMILSAAGQEPISGKEFYILLLMNKTGQPFEQSFFETYRSQIDSALNSSNGGVCFPTDEGMMCALVSVFDQGLWDTEKFIQSVAHHLQKSDDARNIIVLISRRSSIQSAAAEFDALLCMAKIVYFQSNLSVLTWDYIERARTLVPQPELDDAVDQLQIDLLQQDEIAVSTTIEKLFLSILKPSMDPSLLAYFRARATHSIDLICRIHQLNPAEVTGISGRRFTSIETEMDFMLDQCANLISKTRQTEHASNPIIMRAILIILEHYRDPLTLDKVADELGISNAYLSRLFKQVMRTGFNDYLNATRISRAKEIMINGEAKISHIAFLAGFQDAKYFSRVFKKSTSFTPKEFMSQAAAGGTDPVGQSCQ